MVLVMRRLLSPLFAVALALVAACEEPSAPRSEQAPAPRSDPPLEVANAATEPPPLGNGSAPASDGVVVKPGVLKTVSFPSGDLAVPESWSPKVREDSPMTSVHVMPAGGMTCDLAVLEGHGTPKQAEEYLAAGANAYNGSTERAPEIDVGGLAFQGIHITKPKALPDSPDAIIEVYAAIAGDDLIGIGVTRLEKSPTALAGRRSCLQAFAQLTSTLPRTKPSVE